MSQILLNWKSSLCNFWTSDLNLDPILTQIRLSYNDYYFYEKYIFTDKGLLFIYLCLEDNSWLLWLHSRASPSLLGFSVSVQLIIQKCILCMYGGGEAVGPY